MRWERKGRELAWDKIDEDTYSGLGLKDYEVEFIAKTKSRNKEDQEYLEEM